MKPQIIELEDGKWEYCNSEDRIKVQDKNSLIWIPFKRLPDPKPMPELKVGYGIKRTNGQWSVIFVIHDWNTQTCSPGGHKSDLIYVDIAEIHCPHRGLIWSKEY